MARIKRRERDTIIRALQAGVVPKLGLQHIQVGRDREIRELVKDMERIAEGGSVIRFVIGEYGSGKTFFLNLIQTVALKKGMVVMSADLAPDRRVYATGGQARALYAEMARNLATRSKPDGGAMSNIVQRFISHAREEADRKGQQTAQLIREKLGHFEELTGGFDFAEVVGKYWEAHENGNEDMKSASLRWLRAEYATKTDARRALGVRTIINDQNVYDQLKLMSAFVLAAGYEGLLVSLDEMVNLFKLTSSKARNSNYEQLLRILNDVLQGTAEHIGFLFGGTPKFLMDPRRGLYSYEALESRLSQNTFARDDRIDLSGPVIRLANLTQEDLFILLSNIRGVMQESDQQIPDEAIRAFMMHCSKRIGEAYFRTPRNTVKEFVGMLSVLEQNPGTEWSDLIDKVELEDDPGDDMSDIEDSSLSPKSDAEDELSSFRL